jgi:hypothetical protein
MKFICLFLLASVVSFYSLAQEKFRNALLPDHIVFQYAGSIGFMSAGGGYSIFKNKAGLDLLYGYVPKFTGSKPIHSLTLKFTANPWKVSVNEKINWYPLTTGVYFCYTFGSEYTSKLPAWYPDGYYWWSEAIRANLFIGGAVSASVGQDGRRLSGYYEVGTNELKLASYAQNRAGLKLTDILHLGVGMKYHF